MFLKLNRKQFRAAFRFTEVLTRRSVSRYPHVFICRQSIDLPMTSIPRIYGRVPVSRLPLGIEMRSDYRETGTSLKGTFSLGSEVFYFPM